MIVDRHCPIPAALGPWECSDLILARLVVVVVVVLVVVVVVVIVVTVVVLVVVVEKWQ